MIISLIYIAISAIVLTDYDPSPKHFQCQPRFFPLPEIRPLAFCSQLYSP